MVEPKWAYRVVPGDDNIQGQLDQLGDEGWELAAIRSLSGTPSPTPYQLVLKKPKQSQTRGKPNARYLAAGDDER